MSRQPRDGAPDLAKLYKEIAAAGVVPPPGVSAKAGEKSTLRDELGRVLGHLNKVAGGAIFSSAADLLGSTSVNKAAEGFPEGFYNAQDNPDARLLSIGGICEDAMCGVLSGLGTFGRHIGVGSSYGAFISPLGHIAARLHAIGNQSRQHLGEQPFRPFIMICAHAGLKTGEDGPTHADPQPLQLLQGNFPRGTMITLTPWEPQEIWALTTKALALRPAVIAPFVTRPAENVLDREALGLAPAAAAATGVYALRRAADGVGDGTIFLQGSGVTYAFVEETLPLLNQAGVDLNVFYVASAEIFDALSPSEQGEILPRELTRNAIGITGFTLPTMYRWVTSQRGREMSLHPFKNGQFLGSGQGEIVMAEAGLDGQSQYEHIVRFVEGGK
jgi:transketolase